jgi:hypothetical protein
MEDQGDFKSRILEEMTVSYSSKLEQNFELAKQFIRLTPEGTVNVLVRDRLPGKEQILLYLVGKMYAKEAGYVTDENVGNNELLEQLGFPVGSLLPFLKELRDEKLVRQVKRENNVYHAVPPALIEEILSSVSKKLSKKQPGSSVHQTPQNGRFRSKQQTSTPRGRGEASLVLQRLQTELLPDGFFKKPRNTAEVRSELESRFHIKFLSRKVSQALGELHDRGVLSRVGSKYEFQYFTP